MVPFIGTTALPSPATCGAACSPARDPPPHDRGDPDRSPDEKCGHDRQEAEAADGSSSAASASASASTGGKSPFARARRSAAAAACFDCGRSATWKSVEGLDAETLRSLLRTYATASAEIRVADDPGLEALLWRFHTREIEVNQALAALENQPSPASH